MLDGLDHIKDLMHEANKQIGSTKKVLQIPEACGLLILISDKMPLLFPHSLFARVISALLITENGEIKYRNIDTVLVIGRASGFQLSGRTRFHLITSRNPDTPDAASTLAQSILVEIRAKKSFKDFLSGNDISNIEITTINLNDVYRLTKISVGGLWLYPITVRPEQVSCRLHTLHSVGRDRAFHR